MTVQTNELAEAMLDELVNAGVLEAEALTRIRDRAGSAWSRRRRELKESVDLNLYRL